MLRQHLERVHSKAVHCPKCYAVFRNTEARDKHVREGTCQTVPEQCVEGIDEATMFPGVKKPDSPCKSIPKQRVCDILRTDT
jgi:hypothetical protein